MILTCASSEEALGYGIHYFPHHVEYTAKHKHADHLVYEWCQEQFGRNAFSCYDFGIVPYRVHTCARWWVMFRDYRFATPEQAFEFKMRWL